MNITDRRLPVSPAKLGNISLSKQELIVKPD